LQEEVKNKWIGLILPKFCSWQPASLGFKFGQQMPGVTSRLHPEGNPLPGSNPSIKQRQRFLMKM
jgi:hypothetical protein